MGLRRQRGGADSCMESGASRLDGYGLHRSAMAAAGTPRGRGGVRYAVLFVSGETRRVQVLPWRVGSLLWRGAPSAGTVASVTVLYRERWCVGVD